MAANRLGAVVEDSWAGSPNHYQNVSLDAFILMPNHVHGVIIIEDEPSGVGAGLKPALPATASSRRHGAPEIVRAFKTFSARRINEMHPSTGKSVWQLGFYDHVIRGESELNRVRTSWTIRGDGRRM
jgi:putative transposase